MKHSNIKIKGLCMCAAILAEHREQLDRAEEDIRRAEKERDLARVNTIDECISYLKSNGFQHSLEGLRALKNEK